MQLKDAIWYGLLVTAVLCMATGGSLFALIRGPGPFLKACWRLQMTTILVGIGFFFDYRKASPELLKRWRGAMPLLILAGLNMAMHFSVFAWSVDHTSFSHAMILSASAPTLLVVWGVTTWLLYRFLTTTMGLPAPVVSTLVTPAASSAAPAPLADSKATLGDGGDSTEPFTPVFTPKEWLYSTAGPGGDATSKGAVVVAAATAAAPAAHFAGAKTDLRGSNGEEDRVSLHQPRPRPLQEQKPDGSSTEQPCLESFLKRLCRIAGTSVPIPQPATSSATAVSISPGEPLTSSHPSQLVPQPAPAMGGSPAINTPAPVSFANRAPSHPGSPTMTIARLNSAGGSSVSGVSGGHRSISMRRSRAPSTLHLEPDACMGVQALEVEVEADAYIIDDDDVNDNDDGGTREKEGGATPSHGRKQGRASSSAAVVQLGTTPPPSYESNQSQQPVAFYSYSRLEVPQPTPAEVAGSLIAFSGMVLLVMLSQTEGGSAAAVEPDEAAAVEPSKATIKAFTVMGDVAALSAAVFMAANLLIGSRLRSWMPLWLYSFPSFAASAVGSMVLSFAFEEGTAFFGPTNVCIFGWLTDTTAFGLTLAIAFFPTILGHTVSNFVLSKISPVALSTMLLMVPPIGSVYGYLLGLQGKPGRGLLIGGPIILLGIGIVVILGKRKKTANTTTTTTTK